MEPTLQMENTTSPNTTVTPVLCGVGMFDFVMNAVVMGSISVFGLSANVLCIVVLERDRPKLPTTIILQGLAVTDSLFLVYTLLYSSLRTAILFYDVTETTLYISRCIFAYALPWGWTAQTASIWIVTMVTVDRYVAIRHPYWASHHVSLGLIRRALCILCAAALVFNLPRFVYYHLVAFWLEPRGVQCGIFVGHLDVSADKLISFRTVYHIGLTFVFLFIIPFPIIACLNARLIREIWRVREQIANAHAPNGEKCPPTGQVNGDEREIAESSQTQNNVDGDRDSQSKNTTPKSGDTAGNNGNRERGVRTTVSLTAVVTVFVVCETPDLVASVLTLDQVKDHLHPGALRLFMTVKELLLVLNSATNFLIYCVFYARFRKLLRVVCCGQRRGEAVYREK